MGNSEKPSISSDADLIRLTLDDPDQFKFLMRRYEARFLRYIKRITNVDPDSAEDILQEAFIKMYKNIRSFDTKLSFSSWAYRIVRNETISNYRKISRTPLYNFAEITEDFVNQINRDFCLDVKLDDKIRRERLIECINRLDRKYREVVELYYYEGFSYKEISNIIKKPGTTVGTLLNRAKRKLRKIYDNSKQNN